MFKYLIYKISQFIVHRFSRQDSYKFAMFLSDIQYYLSFRDRRAVQNNLKVILGTEENLNIRAREVFRNFGKYLADFFRMVKTLDEQYIRENVKIKNMERLHSVLKGGKGCIVVTAHLGNWELGAAVLSLVGAPLQVIALPHKERPVNDLFNAQRERWRINVVPSNLAVRKCLETLRNNRCVALVADRDFSAHGERMDFLGRQMLIPKGAAIFSAKTAAPILPVFMIREPDDSYTLSVEEPIFPPQPASETVDKDIALGIMSRYKEVIEKKIRKYPTQWLMFREFWTQ